jgi:hypothetical protein
MSNARTEHQRAEQPWLPVHEISDRKIAARFSGRMPTTRCGEKIADYYAFPMGSGFCAVGQSGMPTAMMAANWRGCDVSLVLSRGHQQRRSRFAKSPLPRKDHTLRTEGNPRTCRRGSAKSSDAPRIGTGGSYRQRLRRRPPLGAAGATPSFPLEPLAAVLMHEHSDSTLSLDAVRVMTRLLRRGGAPPGYVAAGKRASFELCR